jgi:hypothetical protein
MGNDEAMGAPPKTWVADGWSRKGRSSGCDRSREEGGGGGATGATVGLWEGTTEEEEGDASLGRVT